MSQARAHLRFLHMAPRKVRLVASTLKGLGVGQAEGQLLFRHNRASKELLKLLRSAAANARQLKLSEDKLYISEIRVDQGPMLKRSLPRAMGRATPLQKKMSHITIVLAESDKIKRAGYVVPRPEKKKKKTESKKAAPKKPEAEAEGEEEHQHHEHKDHPTIQKKDKPWSRFTRKMFNRKSV